MFTVVVPDKAKVFHKERSKLYCSVSTLPRVGVPRSALPRRALVPSRAGRVLHASPSEVYNSKRSRLGRLRATMTETVKIVTLVYAAVMAVGGVGAYARTKSKASIISGLGAAVLLGVAYSQSSIALALGVSLVLTVVFGIRYAKTRKVMPAAILGSVSAAVAIFLAIALTSA
jgi:uncharacterized membrane protein (UPF0136 family)